MFDIQDKTKFWQDVGYFSMVTIGVFAVTFAGLYMLGLTPNSFVNNSSQEIDYTAYWLGDYNLNNINTATAQTQTRPDRIIIDKIGVNTIVEKPNTRNVNTLDQYLTRGAVHYPGSGTIEQGNMFVFGHSSGLPVVQNQAYKAFNNIEKLSIGDLITVVADGKRYLYKVQNVKMLNENDAMITFDNSKRMLTLTTCNTFGSKQDRWVVEAEFYMEA